MGCDGGTIPKRDEQVKTKKKPQQKDKISENVFRWQHCALSQSPLQQPIVACEMGRIYNKDSIIELLLNKGIDNSQSTYSSITSHIRSIKDVKQLNLTLNPSYIENESIQKGDVYNDNNKSQWICPISGQEMNGIFRFVFLWKCGCVFSEKAQKKVSTNECLKCQKVFDPTDIILLNPIEKEDVQLATTNMEIRRIKSKQSKRSKKIPEEIDSKLPKSVCQEESETGMSSHESGLSKNDGKKDNLSCKTKIKNESNEIGNSLGKRQSKNEIEPKSCKISKISANYSIAKDPNVSSTFKSIFTSSDNANTQQKAHWITYNPFYN